MTNESEKQIVDIDVKSDSAILKRYQSYEIKLKNLPKEKETK